MGSLEVSFWVLLNLGISIRNTSLLLQACFYFTATSMSVTFNISVWQVISVSYSSIFIIISQLFCILNELQLLSLFQNLLNLSSFWGLSPIFQPWLLFLLKSVWSLILLVYWLLTCLVFSLSSLIPLIWGLPFFSCLFCLSAILGLN